MQIVNLSVNNAAFAAKLRLFFIGWRLLNNRHLLYGMNLGHF